MIKRMIKFVRRGALGHKTSATTVGLTPDNPSGARWRTGMQHPAHHGVVLEGGGQDLGEVLGVMNAGAPDRWGSVHGVFLRSQREPRPR
jgi:hypothetical protein